MFEDSRKFTVSGNEINIVGKNTGTVNFLYGTSVLMYLLNNWPAALLAG